MIEFKITKKSAKSRARLGILKTSHGVVNTPTLVPVATQATIKTLFSEQVQQTGSQILISNTFHLHLKPGEEIVEKAGGVQKFMNWPGPSMTDSGGFQVFSLGFGKDLQVGKLAKQLDNQSVTVESKPQEIKIEDHGVYFRSPIDGKKLFMGPTESMHIQHKLGADIIFAFDECTPPQADHAYTLRSLARTHAWAEKCLAAHQAAKKAINKTDQALFGVVQGGKFEDLRRMSARYLNGMSFDGFGIGGEFGDDKASMVAMIEWVTQELDENKPRHLLGIGHLEDIPEIIKVGVDTFDCIVPTQYARRAIAFTGEGKLNLGKKIFALDQKPLDPTCTCLVCKNYSRSYVHHLFRAKEISAMSLTTIHNLTFFNKFVADIREQIAQGVI